MKYKIKTLLLSAVTLGLLTSNYNSEIVEASTKVNSNNSDFVVNDESSQSISKEIGLTYHIVRKGETVYSLSNKYGISQEELKVWNSIPDNTLHINQILSTDGVNGYNKLVKESNQFQSTEQFINHVSPIALEVAEAHQIYPSVMIAQAILESNSGKSELAVYANNYFGIKGSYEGNSIFKVSPEEINGKIINESSRFRVYPTLYESFLDNATRLRYGPAKDSRDVSYNSSNYKGTWVENTDSYYDATQGLVDGGYATDSRYAVKLNNIIEQYDLIEYDKVLYDFVDESKQNIEALDNAASPIEPETVTVEENETNSVHIFLGAAQSLPSVNHIAQLDAEQLKSEQAKAIEANNLYNDLSETDKNNAMVVRWIGYLGEKEAALSAREAVLSTTSAEAFLEAAQNLPSVNHISQMDSEQLKSEQAKAIEARNLYNGLSETDKNNAMVVRWIGYLGEKEAALSAREAVLSTTSAEAFLEAAQSLPSVNHIAQLDAEQLKSEQAKAIEARNLYNDLSETDKNNAMVVRWIGYLGEKEAALSAREAVLSTTSAEAFLEAAQSLPSVKHIAQMDSEQLKSEQAKAVEARKLYNDLSKTDKNNAMVVRWIGYLSEKEAALFTTDATESFGKAVLDLPTVNQISKMSSSERAATKVEIKSVKTQYNSLTESEKANAKVIRWAGYLDEKEAALNPNIIVGEVFLNVMSYLPSVTTINNMTIYELESLEVDLKRARNSYDNLSSFEKEDKFVSKWEGYLSEKEYAFRTIFRTADAFVARASQLPTVSALSKMNKSELDKAENQIKQVRNMYNQLTPASKRFSDVIRWEEYLVDKENAVQLRPSSIRLKTDIKYGVEAGDTFNSIANKFQVELSALLAKNPKVKPTNLKVGQTIIVPKPVARPMDHPQARDGKHIIYLDAGHGGYESGASYYNTDEKELNLTIALKLTSKLESMGYAVINSRTNDTQIDLIDRSKDANSSKGDIFVSLHHNAMGYENSSVSGIETFYYEYTKGYTPSINQKYHNIGERIASSAYLAELVQDNLIEATGAVDRGVKTDTFAVLRETSLPAILIEFGFMDNSSEMAKLKTNSYQNKMVNAVAEAIDTYFKTLYK